MKGLILYDSMYGNTEQLAQAIGGTFGPQDDIATLRVGDVKPDHFMGLNLLIVGSPTQRFRPTIAISNLLKGIPQNSLKGVKVAAFDTRLTWSEISKTPVLAFFVKLSGENAYAARSMANSLKNKGGELILPPEGFFVEGMKGPLVNGELERAASWVKQLVSETQ
jgi:flavodoxin